MFAPASLSDRTMAFRQMECARHRTGGSVQGMSDMHVKHWPIAVSRLCPHGACGSAGRPAAVRNHAVRGLSHRAVSSRSTPATAKRTPSISTTIRPSVSTWDCIATAIRSTSCCTAGRKPASIRRFPVSRVSTSDRVPALWRYAAVRSRDVVRAVPVAHDRGDAPRPEEWWLRFGNQVLGQHRRRFPLPDSTNASRPSRAVART